MTGIHQFNDLRRNVAITKRDLSAPLMNFLSNGMLPAFVSQAGDGFASWNGPLRIRRMLVLLAAMLLPSPALAKIALAGDIRTMAFDPATLTTTLHRAVPDNIVCLPGETFEITEPIPLKPGMRLIGVGHEKNRHHAGGDPRPVGQISGEDTLLSNC